MNENDRRGFLKTIGLGVMAGAAVATTIIPDVKAEAKPEPIDLYEHLNKKQTEDINVKAWTSEVAMRVAKVKEIEQFRKLIKKGVDANIIIYDADATRGQFTKRLVHLMKTVARRNYSDEFKGYSYIKQLYMSIESKEDLIMWESPLYNEYTNKYAGVEILDTLLLGEGQKLDKYYLDETSEGGCGGSYAPSDIELVIGVLNNGEVLLGSF